MSLSLKRSHNYQHSESEFVDGAFLFHDGKIDAILLISHRYKTIYYFNQSSVMIWCTFAFPERLDGTLQPTTTCDVEFFGGSSKLAGQIRNPGSQHFTNSQSPLRCTQEFIPAVNQSITIKVRFPVGGYYFYR